MFDDSATDRRRFLRNAGVAGSALLAGCNDQLSSLQGDTGSGDDRRAGIVADVDQSRIQQIQQEVMTQVQSGDLNRSEAQAEFGRRRQEVLDEKIATLTGSIEEQTDLTVEERKSEFGGVVASGSAGDFLDALGFESTGALVPPSTLQQTTETPGGDA